MDIANRPQKNLSLAILFVLLSCLLYALMSVVVKLGAEHSISAVSMVFWRNLVAMVILLAWMKSRRPQEEAIFEKMRPTNLKMLLIRGVSSMLGTLLYFYSLKNLTLANASLLFNTMPIFVPIIAYFWGGFVIRHRLWWGIGLSFLGIAIVLKPDAGIFNPASLLALSSGIIAAIATVSLRLAHYSDPLERMLFYLFAISIVLSGILSLFSFEANWLQLTKEKLPYLIGCGILGFLYQVTLTLTTKHAPVRQISVFFFFTVVLSMLLDWWIWHTDIPLSTWLGFILVAGGAVLMLILYPKDDVKLRK